MVIHPEFARTRSDPLPAGMRCLIIIVNRTSGTEGNFAWLHLLQIRLSIVQGAKAQDLPGTDSNSKQ
jgi:hypothetical protein